MYSWYFNNNGGYLMRKIKIIIILLLVIILAILGITITNIDKSLRKTNVNLYFFNDQKSSIVAETTEFKYHSPAELPEMVMKKLIKGPRDKKHSSIMSKKTYLLNLDNSTENITVDLSREFFSGQESQDILSVYAIVKSLCDINGVKSVKVTVESNDIIAPDGNVIGFMSSSDINVETDDGDSNSREVAVYFLQKDSMSLIGEMHTIKMNDKQPIEQYIVNEIISGPISKDLSPVLSPDTALISAETKAGVCYVNFKASFIEKNATSKEKELLAVYSIVNSLTELENVRQVQFLIDGKVKSDFGDIKISETFMRNEAVLSKKSDDKY